VREAHERGPTYHAATFHLAALRRESAASLARVRVHDCIIPDSSQIRNCDAGVYQCRLHAGWTTPMASVISLLGSYLSPSRVGARPSGQAIAKAQAQDGSANECGAW